MTLALTAESRWRVTVSPGRAAASRISDTTLSPGPRARTSSRSISPQPVTHGASPSSRHPPPAGRGAQQRRPGDQAGEGDATAHLAPASRAEPPVAQRRGRILGGQRHDQPAVLQPDERGGQAAAGQFLHHRAGGRQVQAEAAGLDRSGRPVQAYRGQRVEVGDREHVQAVDPHRVGEQQVVGEPAGRRRGRPAMSWS